MFGRSQNISRDIFYLHSLKRVGLYIIMYYIIMYFAYYGMPIVYSGVIPL